jgi:hypothetical protein
LKHCQIKKDNNKNSSDDITKDSLNNILSTLGYKKISEKLEDEEYIFVVTM